ncbi:MAG: toll/interleukin-1 receptor domain-containing protein, partial [Akkermansia sp.]|nr:toll/interleukin-1 receptor domain-containing protein [Akkermansia sp.]
MTSARVFKYFAFISYSRKDARFAEKLHRYLSYFKLPSKLCRKYPLKPDNVRPIYRDKTDLIIDKLNDALKGGLEVSKYLIVICSENSARPNEEGKNWIDEEVRTFVSLDPENVHRIIPVLLREKEKQDVMACMPPAVRELGLLAADVLDKGRERVFSDVVAKMLDLGPDELWNWVEREQQRRRVMARVGMGVASCALVGGAVFAWDFCWPKVHYYQDYVEYHNVPVGIQELTKEQIAGMQMHYRFTERYYRLQRVETCNSAGRLSDAKFAWARQRP